MADECVHSVREMQRVVELRAADLVNIKLMKTGGLVNALRVNAIAEAAGIVGQVGTMVESSIASAAGLHFAMAQANIRTCEMGGPLMIAGDIGNLRSCYDRNHITLPDRPGLGIDLDIEQIEHRATRQIQITA
jgi:L-Ala-D/L-Glu epimerase